jgi:hypothetical protein
MINKLPYRIVIAASICNGSKFIPSIFNNINKICNLFEEIRCIFIESDSIDDTAELIKNVKLGVLSEYHNINNITRTINYRTGRIAAARNFYLDIIEEKYSNYDYILVLDFNETNIEPITDEAILSNFRYLDWDMICANQPQGYYDLWALRHPIWMPFDCWNILRKKPRFMSYEDMKNISITSRFIKLNETLPLIQVQSAFGGAGFIKIKSINGVRHRSLTEDGFEQCEWPNFCQELNNNSGKIFINPAFVNQRHLNKHVISNIL